jgi:hypothetical protein
VLEARSDVRFTIRALAEGRPTFGRCPSRTLISTSDNRVSSAARPTRHRRPPRPVVRLPSVFVQWTAGESNPNFLVASQTSSRWTSSPKFFAEVRPGIESGLSPYDGGVQPKHLQTFVNDPGWSRTIALSPRRPSSPLDHGIIFSDRGGNRTHIVTRLSTSSLYQFAYPAIKLQARVSHPTVRAYEAQLSAGSPASIK